MRLRDRRYLILIMVLLLLTFSSCQTVPTSTMLTNPEDTSSDTKGTSLETEITLPGDFTYRVSKEWACVAPCGLTSTLDEEDGSYNYTLGDGEHTTSFTVVYHKLPTQFSGAEHNYWESIPKTDQGFFGFSLWEEDADITSETIMLRAARTYRSGSNPYPGFSEYPSSGYSLALSDGTYVYAFKLEVVSESTGTIDALWDEIMQSMRIRDENVFK